MERMTAKWIIYELSAKVTGFIIHSGEERGFYDNHSESQLHHFQFVFVRWSFSIYVTNLSCFYTKKKLLLQIVQKSSNKSSIWELILCF